MGFMIQALSLFARMKRIEAAHQFQLVELARIATSKAWGIPIERLDAALTKQRYVAFGNLSTPQTFTGRVMRLAAVGYGGVMRDHDDALTVVARATSWPVLARELVKGTAELICLHGLNELEDDVFRRVMRAADRIEYEPWMLQTGAELWRRVVTLFPSDRPGSEMLMHIARLPAKSLETLMIEVIERPEWARELIASLGQNDSADPII